MLLFMFLLLPVFLTGYCLYFKNKKFVPSVFIGTMSAILLCAFKTFFLYAHRIVPYDVGSNIVFLLIRQTLLPVIVLYALFLTFSRDDFEFRGEASCPLLLSFYMIYMPYSIISTADGLYSGYSIFIKPLMFLFMILFFSFCAKKAFYFIENKKYVFVVLFALSAVVYLVVPAVVEAYAIIDEGMGIRVITTLVYFIIPSVIYLFPVIKKLLKR